MSGLLSDPVLLRGHLDQLLDLKTRRSLSRDERETLAECSFRLGVDPNTAVQDALAHLQRASRYDGTNPKYAYHLARIYYQHGDLQRASVWIQNAVHQCPTSHRIWAHVSLLQKELFAVYDGNQHFDYKVFQDNSRAILDAIGAKQDQFAESLLVFTPPPSEKVKEEQKDLERDAIHARDDQDVTPSDDGQAVQVGNAEKAVVRKLSTMPRLIDPNRCRWTGILDLRLEAFLELDYPSRFKEMVPLLEEIARIALHRPRGVSAFVISSLAWLALGYPLSTVKRLRAQLETSTGNALNLLDCVCELYETPDERLAARLAEGLQAKRLPPFLATLIHRRRLLWYPLEFKGLEDYRAARRYLNSIKRRQGKSDESEEKTEAAVCEHIKNLRQGVKSLYPAPPRSLDDIVPRPAAPVDLQGTAGEVAVAGSGDPAQRLVELTALSSEIMTRLNSDWDRLLQIDANHKAGPLDAAALNDLGLVAAFAVAAKKQCADAIAELEQLGKSGVLSTPEAITQIGVTLRAFRKELIRPNTFQKKLDKLPVPQVAAEVAAAPLSVAEPVQPSKANNPAQRLIELVNLASEIRERLDLDWDRLLKIDTAHQQGSLDAASLGVLSDLSAYATTAKTQCADAIAELEQLGKSGCFSNPETVAQIDTTLRAFRKELIRPNTFQKKLQKLPVPKPAAPPPASSAPAEQPRHAVKTTPTLPPIGDEELKGLPALEKALESVDRALMTFFNGAQSTFLPYSMAIRQLAPMKSLREMVQARTAELMYRLGRRKVARKLWHSLLCQDRLDVNLLKNIAVCDLRDQDPGRALGSWRSYLEVLYFYDIVEGNPRPHARARADFHREFGNAYAPAFLQANMDAEWSKKVDDTAFSIFLDSPGRLKHFINHKLLEFLNSKLDFTSPLLVLGVRNYDSEKTRLQARDNLLAFTDEVCELLPERIRGAFAETCRRHIQAAWKACASAKRLVRENDPNYTVEVTRQDQWLKDVVLLKKKLFVLVRNNQQLARHLKSLEFLDQFSRLDRISINLSPDMLNAAALNNGLEDGASAEHLLHDLADVVMLPIFSFVFSDEGTRTDARLRQTQYQWLVRCADNPILNRKSKALRDLTYLEVIDHPQYFYPEVVLKALSQEKVTPSNRKNAIDVLADWGKRYSRSTGPAQFLAILSVRDENQNRAFELAQAGDLSAVPLLLALLEKDLEHDAVRALETGSREGLTPEGREKCAELREQLCSQYITGAQNVMILMSNLASSHETDVGHVRLAQAGAAWLKRSRLRHAAEFAALPEEQQPYKIESLDEISNILDEMVVMICLAPLGKLNENWAKVISPATTLYGKHNNIAALYYRMLSWHQLAVAASHESKRDEVKRCLREAGSDAALVIEQARNPKHREEAEQIRQQVAEALR